MGTTRLTNRDQFFGLIFTSSKEQVLRNNKPQLPLWFKTKLEVSVLTSFLHNFPSFTLPLPSPGRSLRKWPSYDRTDLRASCSTISQGLRLNRDKWDCLSTVSPCLIWLMPLRTSLFLLHTQEPELFTEDHH